MGMDTHTDHRVFALEFMQCVMKRYSLPYSSTELCTTNWKNTNRRFTRKIRKAVRILAPRFTNFDYKTFKESGDTDEQRFQNLVNMLFLLLFPDGYNEKDFLTFCIHVTKMASRVFLHGFWKAPDFAVNVIVDSMDYFYSNLDMNEDSWEEMEKIAEEIVSCPEM
ncbi:hypothetical protein AVEN_70245-1 [Araneus ventricosus]|uniref:Uncharacterized protein n=1 Tax=Araneus ventricosus TaxID=182803 RepID=A0A4Y2GD46_ARAVE|nr:hypothetical protein AVEN_70245-1 [Araneus ventricosus]